MPRCFIRTPLARLPRIIASVTLLHTTLASAFAYVIRGGAPNSKIFSSTQQTDDCHDKASPSEGFKAIGQFGVVNWKDSWQARALAFYDNWECSEFELVAVVRLFDEPTGVQYIDMMGESFPGNIKTWRAINMDLPDSEGGRSLFEAKRMVPGSVFIPRLPQDSTKGSYCTGSVAIPPWSGQYDMSSDDPEKWDVYKQAMGALRTTFNEFKQNPEAMRAVLGIGHMELPALRDYDEIQNQRVEEFYDNMYPSPGPEGNEGSKGSEKSCMILPAGQGVPDMGNLVEDPTMPPPSRNINSFNSFQKLDLASIPDPSKKQKPSPETQAPQPNIDMRPSVNAQSQLLPQVLSELQQKGLLLYPQLFIPGYTPPKNQPKEKLLTPLKLPPKHISFKSKPVVLSGDGAELNDIIAHYSRTTTEKRQDNAEKLARLQQGYGPGGTKNKSKPRPREEYESAVEELTPRGLHTPVWENFPAFQVEKERGGYRAPRDKLGQAMQIQGINPWPRLPNDPEFENLATPSHSEQVQQQSRNQIWTNYSPVTEAEPPTVINDNVNPVFRADEQNRVENRVDYEALLRFFGQDDSKQHE